MDLIYIHNDETRIIINSPMSENWTKKWYMAWMVIPPEKSIEIFAKNNQKSQAK